MQTTSVSKLTKQGQGVAATASDIAADFRKRGIGVVSDLVGQARDAATDASDSVIAYTKKNPGKALAIAAVAGALFFALAKANAMRRD
jgi:hypothetical protein